MKETKKIVTALVGFAFALFSVLFLAFVLFVPSEFVGKQFRSPKIELITLQIEEATLNIQKLKRELDTL